MQKLQFSAMLPSGPGVMDIWMEIIGATREHPLQLEVFCVLRWLIFNKYRDRTFTIDDVVALLETIESAVVQEPEDVEIVTAAIVRVGFLEWVEVPDEEVAVDGFLESTEESTPVDSDEELVEEYA